ncbi:MAG: hypothetical protein ACD_75C00198G0002 [uncultured bacterium]|nr:MAG: hypothetical protein ACD_75C00198G0002 [uncultured bacterium]HBG21114.1 hypothetical protein [Desulfobulbaceae bacterium]
MNRLKKKHRLPNTPILTLLTDFGMNDEYVGVVKGVILTYAPDARIVDITHLVPPQNVRAASHLLARTYPYFPRGTVHLVVVDPGVGTSRAILAVAADGQYFVGPDNGIFTPVFLRATSLTVHQVTASHFFLTKVGTTFHGRDIMAPVAARLAAGLDLNRVGPGMPVHDCIHAHYDVAIREGNILQGEILHVDRFGNLCTNISRQEVECFAAGREVVVKVGEKIVIPLLHSYAEQAIGKLLALYDSHDHLEIAVNRGNAALELNMVVGATVAVTAEK